MTFSTRSILLMFERDIAKRGPTSNPVTGGGVCKAIPRVDLLIKKEWSEEDLKNPALSSIPISALIHAAELLEDHLISLAHRKVLQLLYRSGKDAAEA